MQKKTSLCFFYRNLIIFLKLEKGFGRMKSVKLQDGGYMK